MYALRILIITDRVKQSAMCCAAIIADYDGVVAYSMQKL